MQHFFPRMHEGPISVWEYRAFMHFFFSRNLRKVCSPIRQGSRNSFKTSPESLPGASVHFRAHAGAAGWIPSLAIIRAFLFGHPIGIVDLLFDGPAIVLALGVHDVQEITAMGVARGIVGELPVTGDAVGDEFAGLFSAFVETGIEKGRTVVITPLIADGASVLALAVGRHGSGMGWDNGIQ
jgi:hypothetical protein